MTGPWAREVCGMFTPLKDAPFRIDGREYRHREIGYGPEDLKKLRPRLYVLTNRPEQVETEFAAETNGVIEDLRALSDDDIAQSAFYVYFSRAELALAPLRRIVAAGGLFAPPPVWTKQPFHAISACALDSYNEAGERLGHDPFMGPEVHAQLCQAAELTRDVAGDFVEVGVFSGSSALTALTHMRNIGLRRRCWLLDTYSGFTYKAATKSPDIIWSGTHLMDPDKTMSRIEGLMQNTGQDVRVLHNEICADELPEEMGTIALANIDVDLYEAVAAALRKVGAKMARRGVMVVEDPTSTPGLYGAYLAMTEFLESALGRDFIGVRTTTQYFLIRVS